MQRTLARPRDLSTILERLLSTSLSRTAGSLVRLAADRVARWHVNNNRYTCSRARRCDASDVS